MAIAMEQLQRIIADNAINSVGDVYTLFRDSFEDMLQELLETEMNTSIGYKKNNKQEMTTRDIHNQVQDL